MKYEGLRQTKHCRWCGVQYYAHKPTKRDGFCSARCRQAHYRAYKNYVMHKTSLDRDITPPGKRHK